MSVEFVGTIAAGPGSELRPRIVAPVVEPAYVARRAREYEASPFTGVWIGQSPTSADAVVLAHAVLTSTARLNVAVTLPPGIVDPVAAARATATLAHFHPGRVQVRLPAFDDRGAEFAYLLGALWAGRAPVEHDGRHYTVRGAWSAVRPDPAPRIVAIATADPIHDADIAAHAHTCVLPACSPSEVAARVKRLRQLAGTRPIRCGIALRPIIAETEPDLRELAGRVAGIAPSRAAIADLLESPRASPHALAAVTGAHEGTEPFVGTVADIAARLVAYRDAGIEQFTLRGFDLQTDIALHAGVAAAVLRTQAPDLSRRVHDHVA